MSQSAAYELSVKTRRVFILQVIIGLIVAAGFFISNGQWGAVSAIYGGLISITSALLLGRGVKSAGEKAQQGSKAGEAILYAGAALRFILVLTLFALGLAVIKLQPLPTLIGFVAVQMVFLIVAGSRESKK